MARTTLAQQQPDPADGAAVEIEKPGDGAAAVPAIEVLPEPDEAEVIAEMKRQLAEADEREKTHLREVEEARVARLRAESAASEARRRADEAERRERESVSQGRRTVEDAQLDAISNSLTAHTQQMAALKRESAAAFAEGNAEKLADINGEMALLGARINTLEQGKAAIEARRLDAAGGRAAPDDLPQRAADPAQQQQEAWIRQRPPRVQDWLRDHPQFFTDPAFQRRVSAAAGYAETVKGLPPDSAEYVEFINGELGLGPRTEPNPGPQGGRQPDPAPRRADQTRSDPGARLVAAPAGGATSGTPRGGTQTVYLTAREKEAARASGISDAEYAAAKLELEREGVLGANARFTGRPR